eukprot:280658-Prymnesium_polylepis.2
MHIFLFTVTATDSEDSKASSTATTPKVVAQDQVQPMVQPPDGNTPPGYHSGASWACSWEAYARKKRN